MIAPRATGVFATRVQELGDSIMMRPHHVMRTTVDLDEDVLGVARTLARAEGRSIGAVISSLVRQGLEDRTSTVSSPAGFPVFDVPAGGRRITSEVVREAQDE